MEENESYLKNMKHVDNSLRFKDLSYIFAGYSSHIYNSQYKKIIRYIKIKEWKMLTKLLQLGVDGMLKVKRAHKSIGSRAISKW